MPFSAQIYALLFSSPGDVSKDVEFAAGAVQRWNVIYGKEFGANVMPLHWSTAAAAEFGVRPQQSLNDQLVEQADIVIALFWHRVGTDTGKAASGTVEEIEEAYRRGAQVAVLRCVKPIAPTDVDHEQIEKLNAYLQSIRDRALILEYEDTDSLRQRVETILTRTITASSAQAAAESERASTVGSATENPAQVWPRLDRREHVKTDNKGRVKTENHWFLVLSNTGREPAAHVRYTLEADGEGEPPMDLDEDRELEALPPGGEASNQLFLHSGVASQARCIVTWEDSTGTHESIATLRFF